MTLIKARICYLDFGGRSKAPMALRMKHAFEAQGIRFKAPEDEDDPHEQPTPLSPYRMTASCDGRFLYIEQDVSPPSVEG